MKFPFLALISLTIAGILLPSSVLACGMAWSPHDAPALMNAERTLIIWDSGKKHEDFIRSVDFETKSENLGFIVPVPSIPEVADAPANIFKGLDWEMERQRPVTNGGFTDSRGGMQMPQSASFVTVVASFKLAQFDVKVLKADSIEPLAAWLNANKFSLRPALKKWLEPYVDKKYYFTVFKFRKSDQDPNFTSRAVRISFDTTEPYYPYRDSEDMVESDKRHLLLYFLSDAPYSPDFLAPNSTLEKPAGWLGSTCPPKASFIQTLFGKKPALYPMFSNRINLAEYWRANDQPISRVKDQPISNSVHPRIIIPPPPPIIPSLISPEEQKEYNKIPNFYKMTWLTVWEDKTKKRPDRDLTFIKDNSRSEPVLLCPI